MGFHPGAPAGVGALLGYARVSTTDQSLDVQRARLLDAGVHPRLIYEERYTGTKREGRIELEHLLRRLAPGDIIVVTKLDRLGRSLMDLMNIIEEIGNLGAHLRVLDQQGIDTTRPEGKMLFHVMGAFAQFEHEIRSQRQREGIERARAAKKYKGGKPRADRDLIKRLRAEGLGPAEIARQAKCTPMTVWRVLNEKGDASPSAPHHASQP